MSSADGPAVREAVAVAIGNELAAMMLNGVPLEWATRLADAALAALAPAEQGRVIEYRSDLREPYLYVCVKCGRTDEQGRAAPTQEDAE